MTVEPVDQVDDDREAFLRRGLLRLHTARVRGDLVRYGYPRHIVEGLRIEELLVLRDKSVAHLMDAPRSSKED